jgi:hypothetical protein
MVADRPYGEYYDFYSVSPEYFERPAGDLDNGPRANVILPVAGFSTV